METKESKWELFHIIYRTPKPGSDKEYNPEERMFKVLTAGGIDDAKEACKKYHPGCKIVKVMPHLYYLCEEEKHGKPDK